MPRTAALTSTGTNRCTTAECHSDADCEEGYCFADRLRCGVTDDGEDLPYYGYYCATPEDTCRSDEECTEPNDFCVLI